MLLSSRDTRLTVSLPYKSGSCIRNHSLLAICTSLYCEFGGLPRIALARQTVFHFLSLQGCNVTPTYIRLSRAGSYDDKIFKLMPWKYASMFRGFFFKMTKFGWSKRVTFCVEVPSLNILWPEEAYFWRSFCVCVCVCVFVCVLARADGSVRCCINIIYFTVHLVFMSWMKFAIAIFESLMRCMWNIGLTIFQCMKLRMIIWNGPQGH